MNERGMKRVMWTTVLAIPLIAVGAEAQTAGQAKAAQAIAGQAKSGGTNSATPSAPRASSPAGASKAASPAASAKSAAAAPANAKQAVAPAGSAPAATAAQGSSTASAVNPATAGLRRDPFRPLVIKGKSDELPARLPPGKPGLVIGQITIQGIVRGLDGKWIAVADNKTKRAYFLYVGDELYNGSVSRITENTVVFAEKFTDPTGKQSSRDVVKQLAR